MPIERREGSAIEPVGLRELASIASIGLAAACAFAAWDYIAAFDPLPARLRDIQIAFLPFAYMAGVHLVCFGLLAPLFVIGPAKALGIAPSPSAAALGLLSGIGLYFDVEIRSPNGVVQTGCAIALIAALEHLAQRGAEMSKAWRRVFAILPRAVTLASVAAVLMVWLAHFRPGMEARAAAALRPGDSPIPRIVLIVVDTLRADAVSALSAAAPPTPHIDALAAESVVFENAISPAPWTYPAIDSLMTGVAPYIDSHELSYATARLPTLSSHLSEAGYETALISANPILFRPLNVVEGLRHLTSFNLFPLGSSWGGKQLQELFPTRFKNGGVTREVTAAAIEWMRAHHDQPFFLWTHYVDPHVPYAPPLEMLEASPYSSTAWDLAAGTVMTPEQKPAARYLYDAEVRYVDREIGKLLDAMKSLSIYDDALIILTSDHGEEFLEHGADTHGHTLYQELLHVPFIVRLPDGAARRRVRSFAPTQALMPTLLELCGLAAEHNPGWAPALTPLLATGGEDAYPHPIVSSGTHRGEFQRSVILRGMKYIYRTQTRREELFDLTADPAERVSIVNEHPGIIAEARAVVARHEALSAALLEEHQPIANGEMADEMQRRLRSLGYVQ